LTWRKQKESGQISGLTPRKRGRKAKPVNPLSTKIEKLERENERLSRELNKAGAIIDAQKKISSLMGILQVETGIERKNS
jgi:transposase